MPKRNDLTGNAYGNLTVLTLTETPTTSKGAWWECLCTCGNTTQVRATSLVSGLTKSCGCLRKESSRLRKLTFGESHLRLHKIWGSMVQRCKPTGSYGKRGITVCPSWLNYLAFKEWAISSGYTEHLSIDRIDSKLGYSPTNCRWTSMLVQTRNRNKHPKASSEYYGVHKTQSDTYQALVQINRKKVFCKTFLNEIDAAQARDNYIITHQLEGYPLNFP